MKLMSAGDCAATGAWLMSWFHQLSAGNSGGSAPPIAGGDDCPIAVAPAAATSASTSRREAT